MNYKKILIIIILITLITISCIWIYYLYNIPPSFIQEFNELGLRFNPYNENDNYQDKLHYANLNDNEKAYYSCMYNASINMTNHFEYLFEPNNDEIINAMEAFTEDWPVYYWWNVLNTKVNEIENTLGNKYYYTSSTADESEENIKLYLKTIEEKTSQILPYLISTDDYSTIKNIHDYIIENTNYNLDKVDSQDLRSVLLENEGVCAGYAESFQFLCNELGYECYSIKGEAKINNSELHEWNIVQIDNEWYLVDTTFDELTDENRKEIGVKYDNFLATDEIFNIDHKTNNNYIFPSCVNDKYYFYNMPGMYVKNYSINEIYPFLRKWINQNVKEFYFKFSDRDEMNEFINWLNTDGFFEFYGDNISEHYNLNISWKVLEDHSLLILNWKNNE